MNPLLFADWSRIQRMFRGTMWIVVGVLVLVLFFAVSSRAARGHAQLDLRGSNVQMTGPSH